jgi:hypothetical protein
MNDEQFSIIANGNPNLYVLEISADFGPEEEPNFSHDLIPVHALHVRTYTKEGSTRPRGAQIVGYITSRGNYPCELFGIMCGNDEGFEMNGTAIYNRATDEVEFHFGGLVTLETHLADCRATFEEEKKDFLAVLAGTLPRPEKWLERVRERKWFCRDGRRTEWC